ncbi:type III effector protein [Streptomyces sp. NPDC052302]|uniref:type III effector protein n=1 Tax=Streptomyces sp. NPDC052302 TaxID=3365688 RepID=UPI0037D2AA3D
MPTSDERPDDCPPASFLAAETALHAMTEAVRAARAAPEGAVGDTPPTPEQALAVLVLLRDVRHQLAHWETGLIEAARAAGASWADLASPLGVASRQAAERRYLRGRPGGDGGTREDRVKATRDRRAADRRVTAWARSKAGELRGLAGQITALPDLPESALPPLRRLAHALADDDAALLLAPLTDAEPHLRARHPRLATRIDDLTSHADRLRQDSDADRGAQP